MEGWVGYGGRGRVDSSKLPGLRSRLMGFPSLGIWWKNRIRKNNYQVVEVILPKRDKNGVKQGPGSYNTESETHHTDGQRVMSKDELMLREKRRSREKGRCLHNKCGKAVLWWSFLEGVLGTISRAWSPLLGKFYESFSGR